MTDIDLTPFGFTQTENIAYGALLHLGPSSGYALAKELTIARANAYQALNGLVAKGAAVTTDDQPKRFRAERPDAILARVIEEEAQKLDALESQIQTVGQRDGAALVQIQGRRALLAIALRTLARAPGEVTCVGGPDLVLALGPAWRRRALDSRPSTVWLVGEDPGNLPVEPAGGIDASKSDKLFNGPVFLLLAGDVAVIACLDGEEASGYWTSDITIVGAARGLLAHLTG